MLVGTLLRSVACTRHASAATVALLLLAGWAQVFAPHALAADPPAPPILTGASSRKVHGAAGTFDLPLALTPTNPTTEPRQGPAHAIVFSFDKAVTGGTPSVTEGTALIGLATFNGSEMIVPITGTANQQYVTLVVAGVSGADLSSGGSGSVRIGLLLGDVSQNRVVTLADLGQVNAQVAQVVTAANYTKDVNASGTLSLADKGITNTQLTKALPAPTDTAPAGLFEKPHPWTKDVSGLEPSSRSPAIIGALQSMGGWGNGNKLQTDFSLAVLNANAQTPRRTITAPAGSYCFNGPDCDPLPMQMPLPANGNTEGNPTYVCPTASEDCHVLVVEREEKKLYELYNATEVGSAFTARAAFVWDLTKQYGDVLRGEQCTSADAAGLPMAALLPTADEVSSGEVPHALRFILPNSRMKADVYVRPATHAGSPSSGNADAPPYGVRFRLKATFDETAYGENARVILRALKKYGMILSDGGNIALTFADDRLSVAKWAALGITSQTFNNIGVGEFEVVDLGAETDLTPNHIRAPWRCFTCSWPPSRN